MNALGERVRKAAAVAADADKPLVIATSINIAESGPSKVLEEISALQLHESPKYRAVCGFSSCTRSKSIV